jgi:hypothetical protein
MFLAAHYRLRRVDAHNLHTCVSPRRKYKIILLRCVVRIVSGDVNHRKYFARLARLEAQVHVQTLNAAQQCCSRAVWSRRTVSLESKGRR